MKRAAAVDPKEWYTLQDIVRNGWFPWSKSFWAVRNIVTADRNSKNLLKAGITGTGRSTKYHFLGANIIRFVKEWEAGTALTPARKQK